MNESSKKLTEFDQYLLNIVKGVAKGDLHLHDERSLLMPRKELTEALIINNFLDIQNLFDNQLIVPVEENEDGTNLYNAAICMDFLNFLEKLEEAGFPLIIKQAIAETYQPLFWALLSDMDYEINQFKNEKGREPSRVELAYLRVINDWAASNTIIRMEDDILAGKAEELNEIKRRAAKLKRAKLKDIKLGFAEDNIEKIIKDVWIDPFRYFRGIGIKTFIDIKSINWTKKEENILRKGHFDFALCDGNGHLCLVIEYQGAGHYGCTPEDKQRAILRDSTKRSICDKSEIPILQLDSEYAFSQEYSLLFKTYLNICKNNINNYKKVAQLIREHIESINKDIHGNIRNAKLTNINHRLDIFEIKGQSKCVLGLLWELHEIQPSNSPLLGIAKKLEQYEKN